MLGLREQEAIRLKALEYGIEIRGGLLPISPSLGRIYLVGRNGCAPCLTRNLRLFHWPSRRILCGWEHFKLQCCIADDNLLSPFISEHLQRTVADNEFRQMAGDAFSLAAFSSFFLAVVGSLPVEVMNEFPHGL